MTDSCTHNLTEREVACNDGMCPICLAERNAKLLAALRELVACKDLKQRAAARFNAKRVAEWTDGECTEYDRMAREYAQRQPLAWEAAHAALAAPSDA